MMMLRRYRMQSKISPRESVYKKIQTERPWYRSANTLINLFMAVFTAALFLLSYIGREDTKHSLSIADSALVEARKANLIQIQNSKQDSIAGILSYKLDQEAILTQIATLKEMGRQFETSNEGYVQITYAPAYVGKELKLYYTIRALKSPVKIIRHANHGSYFDSIPPFTATFNKQLPANHVTTMIQPGEATEGFLTFTQTDEVYKLFNDRSVKFYLIGNIVYENVISKKRRALIYRYQIEVLSNGQMWAKQLNNENTEVDN